MQRYNNTENILFRNTYIFILKMKTKEMIHSFQKCSYHLQGKKDWDKKEHMALEQHGGRFLGRVWIHECQLSYLAFQFTFFYFEALIYHLHTQASYK